MIKIGKSYINPVAVDRLHPTSNGGTCIHFRDGTTAETDAPTDAIAKVIDDADPTTALRKMASTAEAELAGALRAVGEQSVSELRRVAANGPARL